MHQLRVLANYNIAGPMNAIFTPIQLSDTANERGKRSIFLSKYASLLNGFNFNRNHNFDSVVRSPAAFTFDKESLSAKIMLPELLRDVNLFIPNNYPLYGFSINLGLIPDFIFTPKGYAAINGEDSSTYINTEWFPATKGSRVMEFELKLDQFNIPTSYTLILGIGIRYATLGEGGEIRQIG